MRREIGRTSRRGFSIGGGGRARWGWDVRVGSAPCATNASSEELWVAGNRLLRVSGDMEERNGMAVHGAAR